MIPDYFTNYRRLLEQYEAVVSERITAMTTFGNAVSVDWEAVRTKKALLLLHEFKTWLNEIWKRQEQEASISDFFRLLPGDLPTLFPKILGYIETLMGPDQPPTSDETRITSFFLNPYIKSTLLRILEKIEKEIQTTPIPADKTATEYADQRLRDELREALKNAPPPPKYFKPYVPPGYFKPA
jgi:hypothetical protein